MKKIFAILFLSLVAFAASAQTVISRTAEYDRVFVQESQQVCDQRGYNPTGVIIGSVIGYQLGRELDRGGYRHDNRYRGRDYYDRGRGGYYRDNRYGYGSRYNDRSGRYSGAIVGGVIGSQVGNGGTRCYTAESGRGYYREVLVGYRVTYRDYRGNIYTVFEPSR